MHEDDSTGGGGGRKRVKEREGHRDEAGKPGCVCVCGVCVWEGCA